MGFFDDLLDIGKEFNALRDEVVGAIVDPIQEVRSTVTDASTSLMEDTGIKQPTRTSIPVTTPTPSEE